MSWAANRVTTRVKDRAYSLMGLWLGREYAIANVIWGGEEGISPSSARDHPLVKRPKYLCVSGLQRR